MGTPDFAVPTLTEIVGQGHEVAAVYTQPPRAAGRGMAERRSPVHEAASALRPARSHADQPEAARRGRAFRRARRRRRRRRRLRADPAEGLSRGAARRLPQPHASLLPRWRGAAPIARADHGRRPETGVMVMRMEEGLDTGPVAMSRAGRDRPRRDRGRIVRRLARARRRPDGAGARGAVARRPRLHAAGGGRRHLRQEDRQGRDAHRLVAAGARGPQPHPRPVARPRRLVRGRPRQGAGADQGAALDACGRRPPAAGTGLVPRCGSATRHRPRRRSDHRLRRRRRAADRGAARRQGPGQGGGIPARAADARCTRVA